jgi:hypothetical protein
MTQLGLVEDRRLKAPLRAVPTDARGQGPNLRLVLVSSDAVLSSAAWAIVLGLNVIDREGQVVPALGAVLVDLVDADRRQVPRWR